MQPQQAPKRLELSEEDKEKVSRLKIAKSGTNVELEWLLTAEFGYYYGYAAIEAILENKITMDQVAKLLAGARKLQSKATYNMAHATFIGSGAVNSKNPSAAFKKLTKDLLKDSEADR